MKNNTRSPPRMRWRQTPRTAAVVALHKTWSYVPECASAPTIDTGHRRDAAGRPVPGDQVRQDQSLAGTQEER
jgi:hypothetical protein